MSRPGALTAAVYRGAAAAGDATWNVLAPAGVGQSQAYLTFRELVEPGAPFLAVASDAAGPAAALHGCLTTAASALFSHPWKMAASDQFARLAEPADGTAAAAATHRALLGGLGASGRGRPEGPDGAGGPGGPEGADGPAWPWLTARLGELVVVRGFDESAAILRPGLAGEAAAAATAAAIGVLQGQAGQGNGAIGGVALPFVHPHDAVLRTALARTGFRRGVLTAVTVFDVGGAASFDDYRARQPKAVRSCYRRDLKAFAGSGMTLRPIALGEHLGRLAELEAGNAARHGGTPDLARLAATRAAMGRLLGPSLRVLGVERRGTIVACGIDLVDDESYLGLVYGCDYAEPDLSLAYRQLVAYEPIRFAIGAGLRRVRMGFEAFAPKLYRGARLEARETWIWLADEAARPRLADLLGFLTGRSLGYFGSLVDVRSARYTGPGAEIGGPATPSRRADGGP